MYIGLNALGINTAPFAYSPITTIFRSGEAGAVFLAQKPSDLLARRNLFTNSENLGISPWVPQSCAWANGVLTTAGTTTIILGQPVTPRVGTLQTLSFTIKAGTASWVYVQFSDLTAHAGTQYFNVSSGVKGSYVQVGTNCVVVASTMIPSTDLPGYYECSITCQFRATSFRASVGISNGDGLSSANNGDTVFVARGQYEIGSSFSGYQKVTDWTTEYLAQVGNLITQWDATGTVPVTALEQQVGLQLDVKPIFLGPELVTNGRFVTDVSGWTAGGTSTATFSAGTMQITSGGQVYQTVPTKQGAKYQFQYTPTLNGNQCIASVGTTPGDGTAYSQGSPTGTTTAPFTALSSTVIQFQTLGSAAAFDNISVREVIAAPNTVGQVLRGAELSPNTDGSTVAGWLNTTGTPTVSSAAGRVRATAIATGGFCIALPIACVVGQWYEIKLVMPAIGGTTNSTNLSVAANSGLSTAIASVAAATGATGRVIFLATAATMYFGMAAIANTIGDFFEVTTTSAKAVYGSHRSQATVGAQATLSARYNKVTARNANPVDLTNVAKGGDVASTLTVVSDAAALAAAGLSGICTLGNVYKLDNSAGVALATATGTSTTGNTNSHQVSCWARCTGSVQMNLSGAITIATVVPGASYGKYTGNGVAVVGSAFQIVAQAGAVVYFILMDMREACYAYLPTPQVVWDATTGYDDSGFPARIKYSGAQGYATAAVDFSGSAQLQYSVGASKLSEAAAGMMIELSAVADTNNGSFYLQAPTAAAGNNVFGAVKGTAAIAGFTHTPASLPAPLSFVVSGLHDLSAPSASGRYNGAATGSTSAAMGGTFGSYPLNYGARNNAGGLFFTGDEFVSIVRGGATPTTGTTYTIEQAVGRFMGLNV